MNSAWRHQGYDRFLTIGECTAHVDMMHSTKRDTISATVRTPLFPVQSRRDFMTFGEAMTWCEEWIYFASELLELRKLVANLRAQRQKDLAEITALRNEVHDYRYPHAAEREVLTGKPAKKRGK